MPFSAFLDHFPRFGEAHPGGHELLSRIEPYARGFAELMGAFAGAAFAEGLYRLHAVADIAPWTATVESALPEFSDRLVCFGYSWLGNHFALDKQRLEGGEMLVLLLEPGTGEGLEIPATFATFHEEELVQQADAALAASFYRDWLAAGGRPPMAAECVGYKRPLFLGGSDTVDNLEITDMDVYWTLCGQILQGGGSRSS